MDCSIRCKILSIITFLVLTGAHAPAQEILTLDECRTRALHNNKSLQIADEIVNQARYTRKAARGAYLPGIDFIGAYLYNQKDIQLVDVDNLRTTINNIGIPPSWSSALIPDDLLEFDTHNVIAGAITLMQPLFAGGKIIAANVMAENAEQLTLSQRRVAEETVITAVDDAYWLVVSLTHKKELAESFVALVDSLHYNIEAMIAEGIATRSEGLTVAVALNEAEILLTQTQNSLSLSRMLLAQLCGMPIDTVFTLQEEILSTHTTTVPYDKYNMEGVFLRREEIRSLGFLSNIAKAQQNMALSSMLPSLALIGTYTFNSPNLYKGFKNEIDGMFRVGVLLRIPILHWGTHLNLYKAARSASVVSKIEIEAAKERITLQVHQASYKAAEAIKTYQMTCRNIEKAEENLRNARLAFDEGIYTANDVLAAQTAWRKAQSEKIDAEIAVRISRTALERATGQFQYPQ